MSYKHNDLMAMRLNYWNDADSEQVNHEKTILQTLLNENAIFDSASLDDAKYLFFSLPSNIIVKGFARGFDDDTVKSLIQLFINRNKSALSSRSNLKIKYAFYE